MKESINGTVYFVGAGPGSPDLLTIKGAKILGSADVVVADRLASDAILQEYVNPGTEIIIAGKQGHSIASTKQSEINDLLVELARKHACVVRLKGGDTAFFSNILDELEALHCRRIPYEIVPGITAASGASAYTGVPLTARGFATGVQILSCCNDAQFTEKDWASLAHSEDTLVWYMATKKWPSIARKLIFSGAELKLPLLVVEQASTAKQFVHQFLLEDFLNEEEEWEFVSPSIIILGRVAALYEKFSWYMTEGDRSAYFLPLENMVHMTMNKSA